MLAQITAIYRASRKARDNFWTEILTRPLAAVGVAILAKTPVTPNQVTFLSFAVALAAAGLLLAWPGWWGLLAGALALQASYVLDCVDGQLARLRGIGSPVGHLLDFLMDELKAFFILAAVATRLYFERGSLEELLLGLWGLVAVASGITLTSFLRRPEYAEATGQPPKPAGTLQARSERRGLLGRALGMAEGLARFLIHYPSYFFYLALFDRLEWYLYLYVGVNSLYLVRSFLGVLRALGKPGFRPPLPPRPAS